jgi:hypothetical protein
MTRYPSRRNQTGTLSILNYRGRVGVLRTVELDHQAASPAAEIDNEFTYGKLTAKLEAAELSSANAIPQPLFGGRRVAPEHARHLMNLLAVAFLSCTHHLPPPYLPLVRGRDSSPNW